MNFILSIFTILPVCRSTINPAKRQITIDHREQQSSWVRQSASTKKSWDSDGTHIYPDQLSSKFNPVVINLIFVIDNSQTTALRYLVDSKSILSYYPLEVFLLFVSNRLSSGIHYRSAVSGERKTDSLIQFGV
jgi:hypothetical protein